MRITYDSEVDAAYVQLGGPSAAGESARQLHSILPPGGVGEVILDFDDVGQLLGVEILGASSVLSPDVLASAVAPVLQLRVVIEAEDFDAAMAFYRDALGLAEEEAFQGDGGARVSILDAGHATLEIVNPAQKLMIDEVETGAQQPPGIRIAFEVADARGVTSRLEVAGAAVIGEPRETPWKSLNSRIESPAGQQITVFEELKRP